MPDYRGHMSYCDTHQKALYASRKAAREEIRRHNRRMRAYRCDVLDGFWHVGHLPQAVVYGAKTAREVYGS